MVRTARIPLLLPESEEVLVRKELVLSHELETRRFRGLDDHAWRHPVLRIGSRPAFALPIVDDSDEAARLQRAGDVAQQDDWVLYLRERVDDENGVQGIWRQAGKRVVVLAEHGLHVGEAFALDAPLDRFNHQPLHIFRIDETARSHPPRKSNREPATSRAEIRYRAVFRDLQRIHYLLALLPGFAIRRLEQTQILPREDPSLRRCLRL